MFCHNYYKGRQSVKKYVTKTNVQQCVSNQFKDDLTIIILESGAAFTKLIRIMTYRTNHSLWQLDSRCLCSHQILRR